MKIRLISLVVLSSFLVGCSDLEDEWNRLTGKDPAKGTKPLSEIRIEHYDEQDTKDITYLLDKGKKVKFDAFTTYTATSYEEYCSLLERNGGEFDEEKYSLLNIKQVEDDRFFVRMSYEPLDAKVTKISIESLDEDILTFEETDDVLNFWMIVHNVGECDVKVVAEGVNKIERTFHFRICGKIVMKIYTTDFDVAWFHRFKEDFNLKYKIKKMPPGIKYLYFNIKDSVKVVGMTRVLDMRDGNIRFKTVTDTIPFKLARRTDLFMKGKKVYLRNVSSAVRHYYNHAKEKGYIAVSQETANRIKDKVGLSYKIVKNGDSYKMELLDYSIPIDKYQVNWMNYSLQMARWRSWSNLNGWPGDGFSVRKEDDGKYYVVYDEPYVCKSIILGIDIIGNNPYLMFNVIIESVDTSLLLENNQDEEDDPNELFVDHSEDVVDSLGQKLKDYFVVNFLDELNAQTQHRRDSLARELDRLINASTDTTTWKLNW